MITVTIYKKDQEIVGFQSKGHASYDVAGRDIICAAVSTLVFSTMNAIMEFTEDGCKGEVDEKRAVVKFRLTTNEPSNETRVLLKAFELGVLKIAKEKGNARYLCIKVKEV